MIKINHIIMFYIGSSSHGENVIVVSLFDYTSDHSLRLECAGIRVIYFGKKTGQELSIIPKLVKIFIQEKPDVIYTHRCGTCFRKSLEVF